MEPVEWSAYGGEAVEAVVGYLLCLKNPDAMRIKPSRGDGGIDILVPVPGQPGKAEIYQVKSFTGTGGTNLTSSQKRQIRKSLDRLQTYSAETGLEVVAWYLAVPMLPTNETRTWFDKLAQEQPFPCHWRGRDYIDGLAAQHPEVIDYYLHAGRERLNSAMTSMAAALRLAQRAARRPTGVEEPDSEPRPLEPADTIDGLAGLHDLLNRDDPHYRYDLAVTTSASAPPLDRSEHLLVAAVQNGHPRSGYDDTVVTIKVYARCRMAVEERPIPGSISVDAEGNEELAHDLQLFHQYGRPFEIPQGALTLEVDLPGGLGGTVEGASGSITSPPEPASEPARQLYIAVLDPDGQVLAEPLVDMHPATWGATGLYAAGDDHAGAFSIEMRTDRATGKTVVGLRAGNLIGRRPGDLITGLGFLTEFTYPNSFRVRLAYGPADGPLNAIPGPAITRHDGRLVRALVEALATIQEFTADQIFVPDFAASTHEQRRSILEAARLLRGEVVTVTWHDLGLFHLHPGIDVDPDDRFAVRFYQELAVELPGRTLVLPGFRQIDIAAARVDPGSRCEHDDHVDVRLQPAGSNDAQFRYAAELPPS